MPTRPRQFLLGVCGALVVADLVTIGVRASDATDPDAGRAAVTAATTAPASTPQASASTPAATSSTTSAPPALTRPLIDYLVALPAGASPGSTSYARATTLTTEQYVEATYAAADRDKVIERLTALQLEHVAHRLYLRDGEVVDVVLEQFADAEGAHERYDDLGGGAVRDESLRQVTLTGDGNPQGYAGTTVDSDGDVSNQAYNVLGSVIVEVQVFSPRVPDRATLQTVLQSQFVRLPGG